jgi:N-acetylglucosamine kinase-like BadF-type ATPase
MKHILAIDAGGTKCSALYLDSSGEVLGTGRYAHAGVSGRTELAVRMACHQAIGSHRPDELHIATVSRYLPLTPLAHTRNHEATVSLVGEDQVAYRLSGHHYGIVVLAGTGAFVHILTPGGDDLRLDGRGPLMGDFGSGFDIGRQALQAAVRSHFHQRHATSLTDAILEHLGRAKVGTLSNFDVSAADRSTIASLAGLVDEHARRGDRVSREIIERAADSLAETLEDGIDRVGLHDADLPLIGIGSVATHSELYWGRLCERLTAFAPQMKPVRCRRPPVVGIALCALHRLRPDAYAQLREKVIDAATELAQALEADNPPQPLPNPTKGPVV